MSQHKTVNYTDGEITTKLPVPTLIIIRNWLLLAYSVAIVTINVYICELVSFNRFSPLLVYSKYATPDPLYPSLAFCSVIPRLSTITRAASTLPRAVSFSGPRSSIKA